jgi:prepilin-type N-terminal cleavage/methylation domain-containing protein
MRRAFSIVELMIVVAVIGILAALAIPHFSNQTAQTKESAAKANLRILRGAIEYYAFRHSGAAPGYAMNDPSGPVSESFFRQQTLAQDGCLRGIPENPFNNLDTILILKNGEAFPADATGSYGWIYQPVAKVIRLDWPGTDERGVRYFDY